MVTNLLPVVAGAMSIFSAASAAPQASTSAGQAFSLYAYGGALSGAQLSAKDELAYLVNTQDTGTSAFGAQPVQLTADGTSWLASTNSTGKGSGLDKALFYVPTPKASSGKIGFLAKGANNTDAITDGFELMGKIAMHEDKDTGDLQTNFYAQATDTAGVWALLWNTNSTVDKKGTAVQMRTDQASTPNDDSS